MIKVSLYINHSRAQADYNLNQLIAAPAGCVHIGSKVGAWVVGGRWWVVVIYSLVVYNDYLRIYQDFL